MLHENSIECSSAFDYDAIDGLPTDEAPASSPTDQPDLLEVLRRFVSYIRAKPRARLTLDCLHLALGDGGLEGVTMTDIAKRNGVSKFAVSKRVREIQEDLHLRPNANNKPDHARRVYARSNCSPLALARRTDGS